MNPSRAIPRRSAGVLLHLTSLPGYPSQGALCDNAYGFVEFLATAGFGYWQLLPLGPVNQGASPYDTLSSQAGDHRFISLKVLRDQHWLPFPTSESRNGEEHQLHLNQAWQGFCQHGTDQDRHAFDAFTQDNKDWLDDFALFMALRHAHHERPWYHWPEPLRHRHPRALEQARKSYHNDITSVRFQQFCFYRQWQALKRYANSYGIRLFGDLPLYVCHDSADVWANRHLFQLNDDGSAAFVSGVPPDYFSATGQRWGHPLYQWERHIEEHFEWWCQRIRHQLALFDLVRIDHFRGLEACWRIPGDAPDATDGHWQPVPGGELLDTLAERFGSLPLVAEDLGLITEEVQQLRDRFNLPGMKVLQFAFDGDAGNPHLPHNYRHQDVVYTGTHDNDTSRGWFDALAPATQSRVREYLGKPREGMPQPLVRAAMASVGELAIVPMQDLLGLNSTARMNVPGTVDNNWRWQMDQHDLSSPLAEHLHHCLALYGRLL